MKLTDAETRHASGGWTLPRCRPRGVRAVLEGTPRSAPQSLPPQQSGRHSGPHRPAVYQTDRGLLQDAGRAGYDGRSCTAKRYSCCCSCSCAGAGVEARAQNASARARLDSTDFILGDRIIVHVDLRHSRGLTLQPLVGDSIGGFTVLGQSGLQKLTDTTTLANSFSRSTIPAMPSSRRCRSCSSCRAIRRPMSPRRMSCR